MSIYKQEDINPWFESAKRQFPQFEHLNIKETEDFLDTCERKGSKVLYKGEWLELCKTSLLDDVATGSSTFEELRANVNYGARIRPKYFSVITHITDG